MPWIPPRISTHEIMKTIVRYFGRLYLALAWTLVILVLLSLPGSMIPKEQGFAVPNFDKIVHFGLFGGFVLLWSLYSKAKNWPDKKLLRRFFLIFVIACLYGTSMEYAQLYLIPQRDFEVGDILADVVGAASAYGFCNILLVG